MYQYHASLWVMQNTVSDLLILYRPMSGFAHITSLISCFSAAADISQCVDACVGASAGLPPTPTAAPAKRHPHLHHQPDAPTDSAPEPEPQARVNR